MCISSQLNYSISLSRLELFVNPLTFTSKVLYNKLHMLFFFCKMVESLNIESQIKNLLELEKEIERSRKNLIKVIDDHLSKNPPFKNTKTIEEDVETYLTLIKYSLTTGCRQIVRDWGLLPVANGLDILSDPDLGKYIYLFDDLLFEERSYKEKALIFEIRNLFADLEEGINPL